MKTVQSKEQARVDDSNLNVAETRYKDFPECVCVLEDNISPNNLTDHEVISVMEVIQASD